MFLSLPGCEMSLQQPAVEREHALAEPWQWEQTPGQPLPSSEGLGQVLLGGFCSEKNFKYFFKFWRACLSFRSGAAFFWAWVAFRRDQ